MFQQPEQQQSQLGEVFANRTQELKPFRPPDPQFQLPVHQNVEKQNNSAISQQNLPKNVQQNVKVNTMQQFTIGSLQ